MTSLSNLWEHWRRRTAFPHHKAVRAAFDEAVLAYSEPHRHYHTLRHVGAMLLLLEQSGFLNVRTFWATWYHDVVYDPLRNDNEERSAELAGPALRSLGVPDDVIDDITYMILATKLHEVGERPALVHAFLDADMAILGSPAETYDQYANNVRREFSMYPDPEYLTGRKRFIEKTLAAAAIFGHPWFHARFEQQARLNLRQELARCQFPT